MGFVRDNCGVVDWHNVMDLNKHTNHSSVFFDTLYDCYRRAILYQGRRHEQKLKTGQVNQLSPIGQVAPDLFLRGHQPAYLLVLLMGNLFCSRQILASSLALSFSCIAPLDSSHARTVPFPPVPGFFMRLHCPVVGYISVQRLSVRPPVFQSQFHNIGALKIIIII